MRDEATPSTVGLFGRLIPGAPKPYENGLDGSYISDTIWSAPNELLTPNTATFPGLFNISRLKNQSCRLQAVWIVSGEKNTSQLQHKM